MQDKLRLILENAIKNSRYYSNLVDNPKLSNFPVLKKDTLRNNIYDILCTKYNSGNIHNLHSTVTSGSTGLTTKVYWKSDDYIRSNLTIWRLRKKYYSINVYSKLLMFSSFSYNGNKMEKSKKIDYSQNNQVLTLSKFYFDDKDLLTYFEIIKEFKPEWMLVQTSTLLRIIEVMERYQINPFSSLKYIELNGEVVTETKMKHIRNVFNIPVANMYGAMEVGAIAYECPYHSMHVIEDNVFLETIQEKNDETKTVLITSLNNFAMPIIRYELGDYVEIKYNYSCNCGCQSAVIEKIYGRATDKIISNDGKYISPYSIIAIVEQINTIMHNSINTFKLKQQKIGEIIIILKLDVKFISWKASIIEELTKKLYQEETLNNLDFVIEVTDFFENAGLSKFKVFESNIKEQSIE